MNESNDPQFDEIYRRLKTNKAWYNKSYSGRPIGIHEQGLAIATEGTINPYALKYGMAFQNHSIKDHFDWFWDVNEMKEKRAVILAKVKSDPGFADEVLKVSQANHKKFYDYNAEIDDLDLGALSNEKIRETFEKLHKLLIGVSVWSYAVDAFLSDGEEDWLVALIKEELKDKATGEVIETLTLPAFDSFVNEAEVLFLRIANELNSKNNTKAENLTKEYEKEYFWIRSNYKEYRRVSAEKVLSEAKEWLATNAEKNITELISEEIGRISHNMAKKAELCKQSNISKNLQQIIRFSEVFTHLQDKRKERVLRMNTLFYEFVAETQKRFLIPDPLGFYMTDVEIFGLYDGKKVDVAILQDRFDNGFLTIFYNHTFRIITAAEFKKDGIEGNCFEKHDDIKEFKGTTAYKGIVTGKARVLRSVQEIATFNQGEILVANQTTPEYVPAMKKAAAIVTDQGGITCHAAIVARELKIPAVIGTKIATKVLKDGDMIEVDAERGIVRILKK